MEDSRFVHLPARWQSCVEAFLQQPRSPSTRRGYTSYLARSFGEKSPDQITAQDMLNYVASPRGTFHYPGEIAPDTARQRLLIPTMLYNFAASFIPPGETAPIIAPGHNPAREARQLLQQQERERSGADDSTAAPDPFAHLSQEWRVCIDAWLASLEDISGSKHTPRGHRATLAHLLSMYPGKSLEEITRADVFAFVQSPALGSWRAGQPVTQAARNRRIADIKSFYTFASQWEASSGKVLYTAALPTISLKYGKTSIHPRGLSDPEILALFSAVDRNSIKGKRDYAVLWLAFMLGLRRDALRSLTWGDLQRVTLMDPSGAAREGWQLSYVCKGNSRSKKVKECPSSCVAFILEWLEASGRLATIQPGDPLFTSVVAGRGRKYAWPRNEPLRGETLNETFRHYARLAHLSPAYTIHSLRHSCALQVYGQTHDLRAVQRRLDHASLMTSERYVQALVPSGDPLLQAIESKWAHLAK